MTRFIENTYKIIGYHLPETTIEYVVDRLFENGRIATISQGFPIKDYLYLTDVFDPLQLTKKQSVAQDIIRTLWNTIYMFLTQNERDMINLYKTCGTLASFPYDIDIHRLSSLYNRLDDENCYDIDTPCGNLVFEFVERLPCEVSDNCILSYNAEKDRFLIFIKDGRDITNEELFDIFVTHEGKFTDELSIYLTKQIDISNDNNSFDYLNSENGFKLCLQRTIGSFGRFLFRNLNRFRLEDLRNRKEVNKLFDTFLDRIEDFRFRSVISDETKKMLDLDLQHLNPENKRKFYKQLYRCTSDYYCSHLEVDLNSRRKKEFIRLFRLEEIFIEQNWFYNQIPMN